MRTPAGPLGLRTEAGSSRAFIKLFKFLSSLLLRRSLFIEHWGSPGEVEVVVDVVFDFGRDSDWGVALVKLFIKFVHVKGSTITLNLGLLGAFIAIIVFERVQARVFLVNLGFVDLNSNYTLK